MSNHLYYGEISAKISGKIHQNPDHILRISRTIMKANDNQPSSIWTICADAAKVFDRIEDLSGEHFIDWHCALERYTQEMLDHLLNGKKPDIVDMICMSARSIQHARSR